MLKINNLVKLNILALIDSGPKHGYELIKELKKTVGKVSTSQIYPFLQLLIKNKFILFKDVGEREKKVYSLTIDGKNFVKELFSRCDDLMNVALKNKLVTCAHCNCKVYSGDFKTKVNNKTLHFCCCHCAESYKINFSFSKRKV